MRAHVRATTQSCAWGLGVGGPQRSAAHAGPAPPLLEAPLLSHLYKGPGQEWGLCRAEAPPAQAQDGAPVFEGAGGAGWAGVGARGAAPAGRPPQGGWHQAPNYGNN